MTQGAICCLHVHATPDGLQDAVVIADKGSTLPTRAHAHAQAGETLVETGDGIADQAGFQAA